MITSAGILVYKQSGSAVEVLLVHPGGPFWAKKDVWSIPKGELEEDEDHLAGARREFVEEVGAPAPDGKQMSLGTSKQGNKKTNYIWAVEGDVDLSHFEEQRARNQVSVEWPPRSGKQIKFAENDRVEWIVLSVARGKVYKNQVVFIERLAEELGVDLSIPPESPEPAQQSLL